MTPEQAYMGVRLLWALVVAFALMRRAWSEAAFCTGLYLFSEFSNWKHRKMLREHAQVMRKIQERAEEARKQYEAGLEASLARVHAAGEQVVNAAAPVIAAMQEKGLALEASPLKEPAHGGATGPPQEKRAD
jgi:hypothetical protein